MSIQGNILKNGLACSVQKFVKVFEQLLLVPFFISSWGAAQYGEWLTLTIIPSVLAFSDLGFGSAAGNSFVLKYAAGDTKVAGDIEKTGFIVISFTILLGILLSIVILTVFMLNGWFDKLIIPANTAITALILMITTRLTGFYNQFFDAHFRAARRAALGIGLNSLKDLLYVLAGLIVLISGGGIVVFALSQFLVMLCFVFFFGWKAINVLNLKSDNKKFDKEIAKNIVKKGIGYLTFPAWQAIFLQGTTLVIRLTLGPVAVTVFNTVRTLTNSVKQMFSMIRESILPELQFELGAGRMEKARPLFICTVQATALLSLAGVIFLALFGLPFYELWTQKAFTPPAVMWYLMVTAILINGVWNGTEIIFQSLNKPFHLGVAALCVSIISVICSYFTCLWWGLTGVAIGSLLFEVIMTTYILPVSCRLLQMPVVDIFKIRISYFQSNYKKITNKFKR